MNSSVTQTQASYSTSDTFSEITSLFLWIVQKSFGADHSRSNTSDTCVVAKARDNLIYMSEKNIFFWFYFEHFS